MLESDYLIYLKHIARNKGEKWNRSEYKWGEMTALSQSNIMQCSHILFLPLFHQAFSDSWVIRTTVEVSEGLQQPENDWSHHTLDFLERCRSKCSSP